ncbi:hypothetical protein KIN20_029779 [Parelaphostrongylus tenuis]|uniref:Uncharacterized protein n=1 Tax=Parelaphostrongylus tenuis TaxID=148309 RepID=A0AAD5R2W2_PARTN|nr:hypothetical protein KIN20_029779 [Parelaphostrongylus tenuis]
MNPILKKEFIAVHMIVIVVDLLWLRLLLIFVESLPSSEPMIQIDHLKSFVFSKYVFVAVYVDFLLKSQSSLPKLNHLRKIMTSGLKEGHYKSLISNGNIKDIIDVNSIEKNNKNAKINNE